MWRQRTTVSIVRSDVRFGLGMQLTRILGVKGVSAPWTRNGPLSLERVLVRDEIWFLLGRLVS